MRSAWVRAVLGSVAAVFCALGLLGMKAWIWPAPHTEIAPDTEAAFDDLVLHFDPGAAALIDRAYRDILTSVPDARVKVVVAERAHFEAFVARFEPAGPERFSAVVMGRPITTWSRDRYTLTHHGEGRVLLVPPQKPALVGARANDWLVPFRLAMEAGVEVRELDFDFDGGDFIARGDMVFADANLVRKNPSAMPSPAAVASTLGALLGKPVFVLGEVPEDVPHHHIGMYLTPLPDGRVAVGSPSLAIELLGGTDGTDFEALKASLAQAGLPAVDLRPETLHRFEYPAEQLRAAGVEVVALPLVPLADMVTFITYNNGVFHKKNGAETDFLMPTYRLPRLDEAAAQVFREAGVNPRSIEVADIFRHHGSVRCLTNTL